MHLLFLLCIWGKLRGVVAGHLTPIQFEHDIFLKADRRVSLAVQRKDGSFLPSKHATVNVNVQRVWGRNRKGEWGSESKRERERCTRSSCVIWPHFKMDLWGCREGRGVAFTATFSLLPPKWQDGRAHTKGRVRRLPGNHPRRDERAPVKSWCKNATCRNKEVHLWIMAARIVQKHRESRPRYRKSLVHLIFSCVTGSITGFAVSHAAMDSLKMLPQGEEASPDVRKNEKQKEEGTKKEQKEVFNLRNCKMHG